MTTYTLTTLAAFCDVELEWTDHANQLLVIHNTDDEPDVVSYEEYQQMKVTGAMFGKTVHIEHFKDLGFESVAAFKAWKFEGVPAGPDVDQLPKLLFCNTIENLYTAENWWTFTESFNQYIEAAKKAVKPLPRISVQHAYQQNGLVNGSFFVSSVKELKQAIRYCPWNSKVFIVYSEPCRIDD